MMIKVTILKDIFDRTIGYTVDGHGDDTVCNSVSAITQSILLGLDEVCHAKDDMLYYNAFPKEGKLNVYLANDLPWYIRTKCNLLLRTLEVSLINILLDYPRELDVSWEVVK